MHVSVADLGVWVVALQPGATPSCQQGQGLDTSQDLGVFGQWIIRPHVCLVHRVTKCKQFPDGILPVIGRTPCGRRYMRFDVETMSARLGLPVDDLLRANKQKALQAKIQSVLDGAVARAIKVTFTLRNRSHDIIVDLAGETAAAAPAPVLGAPKPPPLPFETAPSTPAPEAEMAEFDVMVD